MLKTVILLFASLGLSSAALALECHEAEQEAQKILHSSSAQGRSLSMASIPLAIACLKDAGHYDRARALEIFVESMMIQGEVDCSRPVITLSGSSSPQLIALKNGLSGVFKYSGDDPFSNYRAEIAAYQVHVLLNLKFTVPVTIAKRIESRLGSFMLWVPNAGGSNDTLPESAHDVRFFDKLIGNFDREHNGNFLTDEKGHLVLIDHGVAFQNASLHLSQAELKEIKPSQELYARLKGISDDHWKNSLAVLTSAEFDAFLKRKNYLLEKFRVE